MKIINTSKYITITAFWFITALCSGSQGMDNSLSITEKASSSSKALYKSNIREDSLGCTRESHRILMLVKPQKVVPESQHPWPSLSSYLWTPVKSVLGTIASGISSTLRKPWTVIMMALLTTSPSAYSYSELNPTCDFSTTPYYSCTFTQKGIYQCVDTPCDPLSWKDNDGTCTSHTASDDLYRFFCINKININNSTICEDFEDEDSCWDPLSWKDDIMKQDGGTCVSHAAVQALSYVSQRNDWNPYWLHKKAKEYENEEYAAEKWDHYTGNHVEKVLSYLRDEPIYTYKEAPAEGHFDYVHAKNNPTVSDIKKWLVEYKVPVILSVTKKIYDKIMYHAVLAYGYSDSSKAFLIKNSWGPNEPEPFSVSYSDQINSAGFGLGKPVRQDPNYKVPKKYLKYFDEEDKRGHFGPKSSK